jgi:hypothetical protein
MDTEKSPGSLPNNLLAAGEVRRQFQGIKAMLVVNPCPRMRSRNFAKLQNPYRGFNRGSSMIRQAPSSCGRQATSGNMNLMNITSGTTEQKWSLMS